MGRSLSLEYLVNPETILLEIDHFEAQTVQLLFLMKYFGTENTWKRIFTTELYPNRVPQQNQLAGLKPDDKSIRIPNTIPALTHRGIIF